MADKVSVAISACDAAAKEYDDYYKSFSGIDAKAQGTATVGGIVLAAVASFFKDGYVVALMKAGGLKVLVVVLPPALSLVAVILSAVALRVKDIIVPFESVNQMREATDLSKLSSEEFSDEHVITFYLRRNRRWRDALESIHGALQTKANWTLAAQCVLITALFALLVLYLLVLNHA
ncbi:hypothetical protein [Occallatibacter riparius]|uniref:Uncharacterized protein n=1 Tax=Occallatibacter riparius TaxID=1002689 RepID=A0A9J7BKN4_9BACT|nr:hypothetical protein [Occallatibacter riparius]UWZ81829.1 hypothetical protein MOP44_14680 [Occallatibacter riparius]